MKKTFTFLFIVFFCIFFSIETSINAFAINQDGKIHTYEDLYEKMADDCLDFSAKGKYITTTNPQNISYDELIKTISTKDSVIAGTLYWITWQTKTNVGYYEVTVNYKYYINNSEYKKICKISENIAKEISDLSDYEKIKATHDFLIEYNNYHITSDGPYKALYKGQTNCNGYALAFMSIMRECNIDCTYETGDNHAWNSVKLENEWYNIDVCWDDSGVYDKEGGILYDYFLKSNADWRGHHHGNATATNSYNANLDFNKKITNFDMLYTIRNIFLIILLIIVIIIVKYFYNKMQKKNRTTSYQNTYSNPYDNTSQNFSNHNVTTYNDSEITLGR